MKVLKCMMAMISVCVCCVCLNGCVEKKAGGDNTDIETLLSQIEIISIPLSTATTTGSITVPDTTTSSTSSRPAATASTATTTTTTTTIIPTTTATTTTAATAAEATEGTDRHNSNMVWVPLKGKKYHHNPDCSNMKNPRHLSVEEAKQEGYTPCKKCY